MVVTPECFPSLWNRFTSRCNPPISEQADIAVFLHTELARCSDTVVLSGEGGDELIGGLSHAPLRRYHCPAVRGASLLTLRRACRGRAVPRHSGLSAGDRNGLPLRAGRTQPLPRLGPPFRAAERDALLKGDDNLPYADWLQEPEGDGMRRMLPIDMLSWLVAGQPAGGGDCMSMETSLNLRPPFLDRMMLTMAPASGWSNRGRCTIYRRAPLTALV